jgi:pilus assembly protein Flp/PilA
MHAKPYHSHVNSSESRRADVKQIFAKFIVDERGATAIEYGLIAAGISIVILAAVNGIGSNLNAKFTSVNSSLK